MQVRKCTDNPTFGYLNRKVKGNNLLRIICMVQSPLQLMLVTVVAPINIGQVTFQIHGRNACYFCPIVTNPECLNTWY
jgi:hypothetical protein